MRGPHLFACAAIITAAWGLSPDSHAENLLRGPHPFLRDNELALHGGYGIGLGDTFGGPKMVLDYGFKLSGGLWLDLAAGYLAGICRPRRDEGPCRRDGDQAEVLAGVKYKLQMNVPVVPYGKLVAGPVYLFPDESGSVMGVLLRGGVGARYFPYDWIGVGAEATFGLGRAAYASDANLARTLVGLDVTLGAEIQF